MCIRAPLVTITHKGQEVNTATHTVVAAAENLKGPRSSGSKPHKRHGILYDHICARDWVFSILSLLKILHKTMNNTVKFVNYDIQT